MKILIIKTSSLGDIIHAFPTLEYLKANLPNSQIDWVVEEPFIELVRSHPLINEAIAIKSKKWRSRLFDRVTWKEMICFFQQLRKKQYDLVLDLQGNTKSALVTSLSKSKNKVGFGYGSVSEWPNLLTTHKKYCPPNGNNIREDYLFLAQKALGEGNNELFSQGICLNLSLQEKVQLQSFLDQFDRCHHLKILVCPGSQWVNKQLSEEGLQQFLQQILDKLNAHFFLIWGNAHEKEWVEKIQAFFPTQSSIIPRLPLPVLQNVMSHADLVLAMDSLPLHLAGTTSTPSYSIFGPSSSEKYRPIGPSHEAFQGICPYDKVFEKRCDILRTCKTGACIKQINPKELFDHFYRWWVKYTRYR